MQIKSQKYERYNPSPLLLGMMNYREFNNGFAWKSTQLQCQQDKLVEPVYFQPNCKIVFTLQGKTHLQFGSQSITLLAGEGVILSNLMSECEGKKHFYAGDMQREVVLFFDHTWLINAGIPDEVLRHLGHLAQAVSFKINTTISLLLTQLINSEQTQSPWLASLQTNLSTTLLLEILQPLFPLKKADTHSHISQKRQDRLFELLHSGEADHLTLQQMAKICCSNPTTLQKEFQQRHHCTIMQYIRQLKMQKAKQGLLAGMSVVEAAHLVGYRKVECFSKQFFNEFGIKPSQLK